MDTYEKKSQHNVTPKVKKHIWPSSGSGAIELLKTEHNIMISSNLFVTTGFQKFYQEWIVNIVEEKKIFVPFIKYNNCVEAPIYSGMQLLQYEGCEEYTSFFQHIRNRGSWLFIVEDEAKTENIIKAARETKVYIRVYGLDEEGKIKNCKLPEKRNRKNWVNNTETKSVFSLPNEIAPINKVERKIQRVPGSGDIVYTGRNQYIKLGEEFFSNPQSITYYTERQEVQAKIYQLPWINISYFEDKVTKMLEKPLHYEGICWPTDMLYDENNQFVGILVPASEGVQLKQQLMSQQGLEKNFPEWDRRDLTHLAKVILDKIVFLQERNVLFGLINPSAIFVKDKEHVYFTEMDTYQIEGYPILAHERVMQAPELQEVGEGIRLYTKQQDNYGIALLIFMILMPGKFPYNKGNNKNISESIRKMEFAFRYGKHGEEHGAREYFGLWRFVWSHLGNDLKQAFYYTFQYQQAFSTPEKRRDARFWQKKVSELEKELEEPFDKESLRIYPRTFKRFSGTNTIQCTKCGIEHPAFYYKYPEKKICNSCLGQPSQTYFRCKSCNKSFYYDYGTLFKYEKLVETKEFSMPTHCPYCRSDKKRCVSCGKLIPAYRINDKGMCYDCSKEAREKISKVYACSCGRTIQLTQGEVDFYMKKFGRLPSSCKICREKRRKGY